MHIQDVTKANLMGTRGMAGSVVIGFRGTYRRDVQAGAWGRGKIRSYGYAVLDGTVHIYEVWDPPHSFCGTRNDRS